MTFNELIKKGEEYFERYCCPWTLEWFYATKEAIERGATKEEIDAIPNKRDYNKADYNGCDIINAFNAGYWEARKELGLPKND